MTKIADITYEVVMRVALKEHNVQDVLSGILISGGIDLSSVVQQDDLKYRYVSVYLTDKIKARKLYDLLKKSSLKKVTVLWNEHHKDKWLNKWKESWKPFTLTETIEVVPEWFRQKYALKKPKQIYLDTVQAFGTGLHETTAFVSNLIESKSGKFSTFCDVGSGTGILSAVAKHNGAEVVYALDIDAESIKVAQQNFIINGMQFDSIVAKDIKSYLPKRKFDFVAANVITHELVTNAKKIVSLVEKGGYLVLSGISLQNELKVKQAYKPYSLRCLKICRGQKWLALMFKKR